MTYGTLFRLGFLLTISFSGYACGEASFSGARYSKSNQESTTPVAAESLDGVPQDDAPTAAVENSAKTPVEKVEESSSVEAFVPFDKCGMPMLVANGGVSALGVPTSLPINIIQAAGEMKVFALPEGLKVNLYNAEKIQVATYSGPLIAGTPPSGREGEWSEILAAYFEHPSMVGSWMAPTDLALIMGIQVIAEAGLSCDIFPVEPGRAL